MKQRSLEPRDVYTDCAAGAHGWGGGVSTAAGLVGACRLRGLSTLSLSMSAHGSRPDQPLPEAPHVVLPVSHAAGLWRIRGWRMIGLLQRQLRRLAPPHVAFVGSSVFWVVAAKRVWPQVPVIYRVPCLLANCLPFTWPGGRPPTLWCRVNYAAVCRAEHLALSAADRVLVATRATQDEVLAFHPAARGRVVPCYFGCRPFALTEESRGRQRRELGLDARAFVIAAVGVCDLNKAFDWAIREMQAVDRRGHLLIVGEGPQRGNLERLAEDLRVADRVHFVGTQQDMSLCHSAADCVISTSFYDSFPNVIREAMRGGRAVVVPRHQPPEVYAGIAETVERHGGGVLYERLEVGALAECLNRLIRDGAWCRELGQRAETVASRMFVWERCVDEILHAAGLPVTRPAKKDAAPLADAAVAVRS